MACCIDGEQIIILCMFTFRGALTPESNPKFVIGAPVKQHPPDSSVMKPGKKRKRLVYPCRTRTGMSAAVDTAFQKRGFNSLTGTTDTFFAFAFLINSI